MNHKIFAGVLFNPGDLWLLSKVALWAGGSDVNPVGSHRVSRKGDHLHPGLTGRGSTGMGKTYRIWNSTPGMGNFKI